MSLTDTQLKALKPSEKLYRIADNDGLSIEVKPTGVKVWRFRYRFNDKANMLSLGKYPTVTLAEARALRDAAKKLLALGIDPSAQKQEAKEATKQAIVAEAQAQEKAALTFYKLFMEWYDIRVHEWSDSHATKVMQRVKNHVVPYLGDLPIDTIKPKHIIELLKKLDDAGKSHLRMKVKGIISMVLKYAVGYGYIESDPTTSVPDNIFKAHVTKHYATITDPKEIGRLMVMLQGCDDTGSVCAALKMAPLVFLRPGELVKLKWDEIDFDARLIRVRPKVMKMKQDHLIPMSDQVMTILKSLWIHKAGDYVFMNYRTYESINAESLRQRVRRLGIDKETLTPHGFRHMASTRLNEMGFSSDAIEKQLSHTETNSVRRAYNHAEYLPERTKMMQVWADWLDQVVTKQK